MTEVPKEGGRRPSRLQPVEEDPGIAPFFRATEVEQISLYWLPVEAFPMSWMERHWLLAFLMRLRDELRKDKLKLETFLQFKGLHRENVDLFLQRRMLYSPLSGIALAPGAGLPRPPSNEEVREEIEANAYNVDVAKFMPDLSYWFLTGDDEEQRHDFFGTGHMTFLFLGPEQTAEKPPELFLPRILRTHPAMKDGKLQEQMSLAAAMQHPFLKQSKELFGEGLKEHHSFEGIPFVLPFLSSGDFLGADAEVLEKWFGLFGAYCVESPKDKGVVLALKERDFDKRLAELLQGMREAKLQYPG